MDEDVKCLSAVPESGVVKLATSHTDHQQLITETLYHSSIDSESAGNSINIHMFYVTK